MKIRPNSILFFFIFTIFLSSCSSPIFTQRKYFNGRNNEKAYCLKKAEERTEIKSLTAIVARQTESVTSNDYNVLGSLNSETELEKTINSIKYVRQSDNIQGYSISTNTKSNHKSSSTFEDNAPKQKEYTLLNILEIISFVFVFVSIVLFFLSNILWIFFAGAALIIFLVVKIINADFLF